MSSSPTVVRRTLTMSREPSELVALWERPDVLPRVMGHFAEVTVLPDRQAHWRVPAGSAEDATDGSDDGDAVEWDTRARPGPGLHELRWQSDGGDLDLAGDLQVRPAPHGLGSEVTLHLEVDGPRGALRAAKPLTDRLTGATVATALRRFKALAETGEIPTLDRNPAGHGQTGHERH